MLYEDTQQLYQLLKDYRQEQLELFDFLDECLKHFDGIRGVCSWLTINGKETFDGYCFDDLVDYYTSCS